MPFHAYHHPFGLSLSKPVLSLTKGLS